MTPRRAHDQTTSRAGARAAAAAGLASPRRLAREQEHQGEERGVERAHAARHANATRSGERARSVPFGEDAAARVARSGSSAGFSPLVETSAPASPSTPRGTDVDTLARSSNATESNVDDPPRCTGRHSRGKISPSRSS